MEEKRVVFSVKMSVKELYRFIMYHAYHKFSGVLGIVLSIVAFVILVTSYDRLTEQTRAVMILVALWFVLIDPIVFYMRAVGQVKRNPAYKRELNYIVDEYGITISQGEQQQQIAWSQLLKIVETKNQFLLYSNPMYAFIFPKESIGIKDCVEFRNIVKECTKDTRVLRKGLLKK